jgi:ubiquinone/menaquinone biosynthesis C-methylase UbiE
MVILFACLAKRTRVTLEIEQDMTPHTADTQLQEPWLSEFRNLIRKGASAKDIHDPDCRIAFAAEGGSACEGFVNREIQRVSVHQKSLCPVLEAFVGKVDRVLDVGCGSGGTTVAIAQSPVLRPDEVVGIDPNQSALRAAEIRARGHQIGSESISFRHCAAQDAFPFEDNSFSLATCVSVLEFIPALGARERLVGEIIRVVRPGGFIFLSTPSPYRLRELHSGRWLGDYRRRRGYPWSSTPRQLRKMLSPCRLIPIGSVVMRQAAKKLQLPHERIPGLACSILSFLLPWQKVLARKPA